MKIHNIRLAILLFFFSLNAYGEDCISAFQERPNKNTKYFILNLQSNDYKVNTVKLNSKALYDIDSDIELFNVLFKDRLILFSVLPTKKPWGEIDTNAIKSQLVSSKALLDIFQIDNRPFVNMAWYPSIPVKRNNILLIVKRNGKCLVAEYCISEYFRIVNGFTLFPNQMPPCDINVLAKPLSIKSFENDYKRISGFYSPNPAYSPNTELFDVRLMLGNFERPTLFFSKKILHKGMEAYRFWLYDSWYVTDGPNEHRGIDRFLYVKDVGILGGSYDFWFERSLKGDDYKKLFSNYMDESVMYPTEINGKLIQ